MYVGMYFLTFVVTQFNLFIGYLTAFYFPTRSDINQAVQSQKLTGGCKFWMKKLIGLLIWGFTVYSTAKVI